MGRLTEQEAAMLKRLQQKAEAPDAPTVGRSISVSIDLGDDKQVARAMKLGLLDGLEDDADDGGDDSSDESGDDTPKRRGYFAS